MKKELIEFGLKEKEAEIYLICLKTGEATANRISNLAHLARSTTYDVLEKLRHKGFINIFVKDKKTYFTPTNPEIIVTTIEEKKKEIIDSLDEKKEKLGLILPKLKKIQNKINEKPIAEVFEGIVSISKILDEIIDKANFIKIIGSQEKAVEKLGYRTDRFRTKRKNKKIKVMQILEDSTKARKEKIDKFTEVKFLKSLKNSDEATFIYSDTTVHLIQSQEMIAIKIKSKEYTNMREIIFDELWKKSKK